MGKRGRKPFITFEQRLAELRRHTIFDDNGSVKKERDPVWVQISDILNLNNPEGRINPKNLYMYVSQNRCGILSHLKINLSDTLQDLDKEDLRKHSFATSSNVEEQLISLQSDALYKPSVKEINILPFTILQWSIETFDIISSISKDIQYIFGIVGTFCENFVAPDGSVSATIFLSALGMNVKKEFVPICQITTEQMTSISLFTRFFSVCIKDGLPIPRKINIDFIWNHYTAANNVFNVNLTYEQYLLKCFAYLNRNSNELPRCLIKTNIKFLIIEVVQWKCINDAPLKNVKLFYIYCIILLSMQNSLKNFEDTLEKVFAFSYSKFQSDSSQNLFNCIMSKIKTLKIDSIYNINKINEIVNEYKEIKVSENIKNINYHECKAIINHIKYIFFKSKECIPMLNNGQNCERNGFYNKEFCKCTIQLCTEFLIWSNVMCEDRDDYFKEDESIKLIDGYKINFEKRLHGSKVTADEYLMKNIDYVEEKLQVLRDSIKKLNFESFDPRKFDFENTYLLHEENWMGRNPQEKFVCSSDSEATSKSYTSESEDEKDYNLDLESSNEVPFVEKSLHDIIESVCQEVETEYLNEKPCPTITKENKNLTDKSSKETLVNQKKKLVKSRGKFLRPCAEIDLLHQKPIKMIKHRLVIKNYNSVKTKKVNKSRLSVLTSSFFDSILEIFTSVYFNVSEFQNFINTADNIIFEGFKYDFLLILHSYVTTLDVKKLYTNRANFISKICTDKYKNKLCWTQSIGDFFEKVVYPNIFTKLLCLDCDTFTYLCSNRIKLQSKELISENLGTSIYRYFEKESQIPCDKCKQTLILSQLEIKNLFCIDVEESNTNIEVDQNCAIKFDNLIIYHSIGSQTLVLVGLVTFEEPIGSMKFRHYLSYCRNADGSWFKYDNTVQMNKPVRIKIKDKCVNIALAIYFAFNFIEST